MLMKVSLPLPINSSIRLIHVILYTIKLFAPLGTIVLCVYNTSISLIYVEYSPSYI
jgi:hypothetical protein